MNKVYILEMYDPEHDFEPSILNVFSSKEKAEEWRDRYIREEYNIEDVFVGDLQREVYPAEFSINTYHVL